MLAQEDLLQVSSLSLPTDFRPLHNTKREIEKFEDIKGRYRGTINKLYVHFLDEAMKKYNAKYNNISMGERTKLKEQGLECYRLCLKLVEVSLIVRKQGQNLDLGRI